MMRGVLIKSASGPWRNGPHNGGNIETPLSFQREQKRFRRSRRRMRRRRKRKVALLLRCLGNRRQDRPGGWSIKTRCVSLIVCVMNVFLF